METLSLAIDGMSCGHCVNAVRQALEQLASVEVQSVDIGHASVRFDRAVLRPEQILAAVTGAGYQATTETDARPAR